MEEVSTSHFLLDEDSFDTEVFSDDDEEVEMTESFFRTGQQGEEFTQAVSLFLS